MRQPSLAATRLAEDSRRGRRAKSERSSPPCAPEALRSARILTRSPPSSPPRAQVDEVRPTVLLVNLPPVLLRAPIPRRERFLPPRDHHHPRHAPGVEPEARDVAQGARTSGRFARRVDRSGRGEDRRQSARPPPSARRSRPARCARTPRPANRTLGSYTATRPRAGAAKGSELTVGNWLAHHRAHGETARRAVLVRLVRREIRWGLAVRRAQAQNEEAGARAEPEVARAARSGPNSESDQTHPP